jgi:hypothetical protein
VLLTFNCLALIGASQLLSGSNWLGAMGRDRRSIVAVCLGAAFFIPIYDAWVRRGKHVQIAEEFAVETAEERRRRTTLLWSYLAATIATPIVLVIATRIRNGV